MYPVDFPARLITAQQKDREVNCISATLFLLGLTDPEAAIAPEATRSKKLKDLFVPMSYNPTSPLLIPDEAVAFGARFPEDDYYDHMGIIAPFNRSLAIQRSGIHHPISLIPIRTIIDEYVVTGHATLDFLKFNTG